MNKKDLTKSFTHTNEKPPGPAPIISIDKEALLQFLRDNLRIEINGREKSYYTNSVTHTVQLLLEEKVISEANFETF